MRRVFFLASVLVVVSCNKPTVENVSPQSVKAVTVSSVGFVARDYAGMATADNSTNLAFKVGGQVVAFDVSEGQYVRRGEVMAEINPRDYQLAYDAERSAYNAAKSQLERAERLLARQAISRSEYENAQNAYASALSAYRNAGDVLGDTKLRTPIDGVVEKKYVDTYQRVSAGETVVRIVDPVSHTVKFTMPESGLSVLETASTRFSVQYDNYKGVWFEARLKDYVPSSSDGTGVPVSLRVTIPEKSYIISPGMSCIVRVSVTSAVEGVAVPLSALFTPDNGNSKAVWVVRDGRAVLTTVTTGALYGTDMILVTAGLHQGDDVVTAGVYKLSEGQQVNVIR